MRGGEIEDQGSDRDFVASLEKGLLVIEAFDASRPRLTLSDVAKLTGITRAAARRSSGHASLDRDYSRPGTHRPLDGVLDHPGTTATIRERLGDRLRELEVSHPKLSSTIGNLVDTLAFYGI